MLCNRASVVWMVTGEVGGDLDGWALLEAMGAPDADHARRDCGGDHPRVTAQSITAIANAIPTAANASGHDMSLSCLMPS